MADLTIDDLIVLGEAMEAWESKDSTGELLGGLMGAMMMGRATDDEKAKFQAEEAARRAVAVAAQQQRKERSILLRAKLIQMTDALRAERLGGVVK